MKPPDTLGHGCSIVSVDVILGIYWVNHMVCYGGSANTEVIFSITGGRGLVAWTPSAKIGECRHWDGKDSPPSE